MINILFTSAGRRIELLRAFRAAYQALRIQGHIVCTDIDPLAPALQEVDMYHLTPRTLDPDFIPAIVDICRRENIQLVFPLIDPDIPVLSQARDEIERTGAKLMIIPETGVRAITDKWETFLFFRQHGIRTPQSWLPQDVQTDDVDFPVFIKPRFGSAAKNTFKVNNINELAFFQTYIEQPIIQEFLPGTEITNDVICDLSGKVLSVVSRERIEARWGEVAKGKTLFDPAITEESIKIAHALQAIGPITVQCMLHNDELVFTEVNARYGGGAPLGIAAGVPSPEWYLRLALGEDITPLAPGAYQHELYITRYDQSFFLSTEEVVYAQKHRI